MNQNEIGKYIILGGIILVVIGVVYYYYGSIFNWQGKLPGDIRYESGNSKVFFPITTCIVVTIFLNVVIYLVKRFF